MAKQLIINADDFGLTESINSGIAKACETKALSSASLIAAGRAFNHARKLIARLPGLDVGLHLALTSEKPVIKPEGIKSLVNKNGYLFPLPVFLLKYLLGRISKEEIELELEGQFVKAINSGIRITHVDGHNHIHILPCILKITIKLCKKFNIRYIRVPREKVPLNSAFAKAPLLRLILMCIIAILAINSKNKIKKSGLNYTRFFWGFLNSGNLKLDYIQRIILSLKDGVSELMVHPGELDEELKAKYGHWKYNWESELHILTQKAVKTLLKTNSVTQTNFKELY